MPVHIYVVTHAPTGRCYVGLSKKGRPRWQQHKYNARQGSLDCPMLYNAMRKHGVDEFEFQIVATLPGAEEAAKAERTWILALRSDDREFGFNRDPGGSTGFNRKHSPETIEKLRQHSLEHPRRYWLGRTHSDETKAKIAEANRLRPPPSEETIQKRAAALRGRKRPEVGAKAAATRMKHTPEERRQMALKAWETRRARGTDIGYALERGPAISARNARGWETRRANEAARRKATD